MGLWSLRWLTHRMDGLYPSSAVVPNVPFDDVSILSPMLGIDPWNPNGREVRELPWTNVHESVPGTVWLTIWRTGSRAYYRIKGPINPDYKLQRFKFPLGLIFFSAGEQIETWELRFHEDKLSISMRKGNFQHRVPHRRYRGDIQEGYLTFEFWVPDSQKVGNIVFNYEEAGYLGWVAMEKPGSQDHGNSLNWNMP